ncbi:MAG: hypothetical protein LBR17_05010 [Bacteroidales bacterium]|jgi:hypothetical protein|nr:hypothetical protein [Bacteroidales bacterium]
MKPKFVLIIILFISGFSGFAQCPFGNGTRVNCIHGCGRFIDENNDGFCDNGNVEQIVEQQKDTIITKSDTVKSKISPAITKKDIAEKTDSSLIIKGKQTETATSHNETSISVKQTEKEPVQTSVSYPVISISASVIALYFITLLMVKTERIKKITHRRIWNIILLISFLLSCIGGFYLVLQLNYHWSMGIFSLLLQIHVLSGLVMTLIGIIHILWHLTYFKRILKPNKN